MLEGNSTLSEPHAFHVVILEDLWKFFIKLLLLTGKTLYLLWTRLFRLDNIRWAFWSAIGIFKRYVFDVSWATMTPIYKGSHHLAVSINPLWHWMKRFWHLCLNASLFVLDILLHLVDVVRIAVPLEHLVTAWFIYVQWIPFLPLPYPSLRLMFAAWYPFVAASAWVKAWNILVNVAPVWQVVLGQAVEVRLQGQHFLYALASALALWKLHTIIGSPALRKRRKMVRDSPVNLDIAHDYFKDFGGAMTYVGGEFKAVDLPRTKSEMKKVQKLRKFKRREMEEKVRTAMKHFFKDHETNDILPGVSFITAS